MNLERPVWLMTPLIERKAGQQKTTCAGVCNITSAKCNVLKSGTGQTVSESVLIKSDSIKAVQSFANPIVDGIIQKALSNRHFVGTTQFTCECTVNADNFEFGPGAGLSVYDENGLVKDNVTSLNFAGTDIEARDEGTFVSIYVPPPAQSSHFNTLDGVSIGTVSDISTTNRWLSSPTVEGTPFFTGGLAGTQNKSTNTSPLTWTTTQEISFYDQTTTFDITISDPSGTIAQFTTPQITGNQTEIGSNITVNVAGWDTDGSKFKGNVTFSIDINAILPNSGIFALEIIHHDNIDGDFSYSETNIFYDANTVQASIANLSYSLNTEFVKLISGVTYLTTGTTFDFNINDIDNINNETYPTTQIIVNPVDIGITEQNVISSDLTSWTNLYNNVNASWSNTLPITITNFRNVSTSIAFSAAVQDWITGTQEYSPTQAMLIDTYIDTATNNAIDILEPFNGESQRVLSNGTAWNSSNVLNPNDLLIHNGELKVQQIDFTIFIPNGVNGIVEPNYSVSGAETQYYYRFYTTDGTTRSGGVFNITGVNDGDLGTNVQIDISFNGVDWFDCCSNYLGGSLVNGDGCRVPGKLLPELEFTLSTYTTNDSTGIVPVNSIILRIAMPNTSNVKIGQINMTWNI